MYYSLTSFIWNDHPCLIRWLFCFERYLTETFQRKYNVFTVGIICIPVLMVHDWGIYFFNYQCLQDRVIPMLNQRTVWYQNCLTLLKFLFRSFTSDTSISSNREESFVKLFVMVCEKKDPSLMFSVDRKIPTIGSTISVWNFTMERWTLRLGFSCPH